MEKEVFEIVDGSNRIGTGSKDLDNLFEGGYEKDVLTLFYGPYASGKTNYVLIAVCEQAKLGKKVIFIDTEGSFSVDRIRQISGPSFSDVMKNIVILKPTTFREQKESFFKMVKEIRDSKNIGMIVIDSITLLYRLELGRARGIDLDEVSKINFDLGEQLRALSEISRKKKIPVLITSQVYTEFLSDEDVMLGKQAGVNIVGGDLLKYWCKCIIELQGSSGKKKLIIKKHRSIGDRSMNFEIVNDGIRKKGWM